MSLVFKNVIWLFVGEGLFRFFTIALFIYAARLLGPSEFGVFSFVLSFVAILALLVDFGISDITIREFARRPAGPKEYSSMLLLRVLLWGAASVFIAGVAVAPFPESQTKVLAIILSLYATTNVLVAAFYAFFRAQQRMHLEALLKISHGILMGLLGFLLVSQWPTGAGLGYALLAATISILLFAFIIFHFGVQKVGLRWAPRAWKSTLKLAWPLGTAMIFGAIYTQIDSVMLGFFGLIDEVGWYNAAYRLLGFGLIPMTLISASFYPALSAMKEGGGQFQNTWNTNMKVMILLAVPLLAGSLLVAPELIPLLYTVAYTPAVLAFQILAFGLALHFLFDPYTTALVVRNHQREHLWAAGIGALVNVALNTLLIPHFSLYGAAIATVVTYGVILGIKAAYVQRLIGIHIFQASIIRTLLAALSLSLLMALLLQTPAVAGWHVFVRVFGAGAFYAAGAYLLYRFRLFSA